MPGIILLFIMLIVALYGYYIAIKQSPLERDIRKNNLDYECFRCKEKFSINLKKCPKCSQITIYGSRKKKFWMIYTIFAIWLVMFAKFGKVGLFDI